MPHVKELESIVSFNFVSPAIDTAWFPNTPAAEFWSGSPRLATSAFSVNFSDGSNPSSNNKSNAWRVRLVRAGQ
jgi:Protein of unknown function (DUF1566)